MEIQLQELIDQIKKNGVEAAESEAASILEAAGEEAAKIRSEAAAEAEKILAEAREESARFAQAGEDAVRQAGRNLLISFRESVNRELDGIMKREVDAAYSSAEAAPVILKAVEAWAAQGEGEDLSVLLNARDLERLEGAFLTLLREKLAAGVTLKPRDDFDGGFRIALKNDTVYYDYSAQAVAEMLAAYLNPKVAALLKEAAEQ